MSNAITDIRGFEATVGTAAPLAQWSTDVASTFKARHQLAVSKPMTSAYEVKTINGFDRRPSEGST
jgi:hypothetical protein